MEESHTRRRFLAAAGAALFAGCSSGGDDESPLEGRFDTNATTVTGTGTPSPTTSPAPPEINIQTRRTETLESVETAEAPDGPRESAETTTSTPDPEQQRANTLDDARSRLESALGTYTGAGEGFAGSILDTRADTRGFDRAAIEADIEEARAAIDRATAGGTTASTRVAELRAFATYLSLLAECQAAAIELYEQLDTAVTALFDEDFGSSQAAANGLESAREAVTRAVDDLEAETDPSATALVRGVSRRDYARKLDQFRAEVDSTRGLESPLSNLREAMEALADGIDSFAGGGNYSVAQSDFIRAQNGFEIASVDLDTAVPAGGMKGPVSRATTAAKQGVSGCEALISAAEAGARRDESELESKRETAIKRLGNSAEISDSPSYRQLLDP
jgi:hypothetical protein